MAFVSFRGLIQLVNPASVHSPTIYPGLRECLGYGDLVLWSAACKKCPPITAPCHDSDVPCGGHHRSSVTRSTCVVRRTYGGRLASHALDWVHTPGLGAHLPSRASEKQYRTLMQAEEFLEGFHWTTGAYRWPHTNGSGLEPAWSYHFHLVGLFHLAICIHRCPFLRFSSFHWLT